MTRDQAKKLLPVFAAWAEGKTIQVKGEGDLWYDCTSVAGCDFASHYAKWRVKPEPREWWVIGGLAFDSLDAAKISGYVTDKLNPIHVREVLDTEQL